MNFVASVCAVVASALFPSTSVPAPATLDEVPLERHAVWPDWTEGWHRTAPMPAEFVPRVPFWTPVAYTDGDWNRAVRGWTALEPKVLPRVVERAGEALLEVPAGGALAVRPFAAHPAHMAGLTIEGAVSGPGRLVVRGGDGRVATFVVGGDAGAAGELPSGPLPPLGDAGPLALEPGFVVHDLGDGWRAFRYTTAQGELVPRFEVGLGVQAGAREAAQFRPLRVRVPMPTPSALALDARIEALVVKTLDELVVRGGDTLGPQATGHWIGLHNVDSGERLFSGGRGPLRAGYNPILGTLFRAVDANGADLGSRTGPSGVSLAEHLARGVDTFLDLCLHPETHLPRRFDPASDVALDDEPVEAAAYLDFLIDLAGGPEGELDALAPEQRARAWDAALAMGRALVEFGALPTGEVAAVVRASDGWTSTQVVHLRRLDVPAQLARLARACETRGVAADLVPALVELAIEAVFEVEYANLWPGTWNHIDPGFDDSYGHIGARSAAMLAALPAEPGLGQLAESGRATYLPLWRDAVAFGGSVAADQVRCWKILAELDALGTAVWSGAEGAGAEAFFAARIADPFSPEPATPTARDTVFFDRLMHLALAGHFVGEATNNGSWLDVTVVGFAPATNLPVGDVIGLPQNMFGGFATVRELERRRGRAMPAAERAMLWTLLDDVEASWGAAHGFADGTRTSGGGIRLVPGLVRWLAAGK